MKNENIKKKTSKSLRSKINTDLLSAHIVIVRNRNENAVRINSKNFLFIDMFSCIKHACFLLSRKLKQTCLITKKSIMSGKSGYKRY